MSVADRPLRLHCIDHVAFEGAAAIADWCAARGHALARTRVFEGEPFPSADAFDLLFVLGGPMGVQDVDRYPWLVEEKQFLRTAIAASKGVVGICLGAQLLADVLGGTVRRHNLKEIGWHPVALTPAGRQHPWFRGWPSEFMPFHWHGDTYSLPPGAVHVARSEGCEQQAFVYGGHVLGLQFHLECTEESIQNLMDACPEDWRGTGQYVQNAEKMLHQRPLLEVAQGLLFSVLDRMAESLQYPAR